ncbi:MAG TPA: preprotein translocase subunit YajC [Planctomycetaceae bacterium]|nr:preprotein translocase subunit YajC [Planctomycetaceae bacterium]
MESVMARLLLLAQSTSSASGSGEGSSGGGSSYLVLVPPILMMIVFFYFLVFLPQKRERQKQDQFHKNLKKNDRVVTIGGVVGTIVNIEPEGKLITLKVDDNTRMSFLREAIQRKYGEGNEAPALKETPK